MNAGPAPETHSAWVHLIYRQIEDVISALREARQELDPGVNDIAQHPTKLGDASMELRNPDNSNASIDGMVQLLIEAFKEITEITADNVRLADDSHSSLKPVSDVTENLCSVVVEVSLNIQLIALNAQVRSVQLGDGSGLEVLAARTSDISAELAAVQH
ncbi:MAG: hypothetical protein J6386_20170 [Candidatus Synoicihabitans palmerolidicus]|nr:hypothetical protein [Candidatus Synoicihabitans palmerolidicus]